MDNNNLIINVMYYSLFRTQLFNNEKDITKYFPKNTFGIFSTIRRANKIKSYPIDIHGCIGYWDTNFKTLNKKTLYDNLLRVAHDSVWTDSRNKYFAPIETDPETALELDFMLNPIYSINKQTGIITDLNTIFTNNIFGIIIQTVDKKQRATFLPNVFPNICWKNIIISLKEKANITSDDFELFAYKIIQIKSQFINIIKDKLFSNICIFNFSRLLIDNMNINLKYPFIYGCKNNVLEWNANDDVRNIAILSEIFRYANLYPYIATKNELKNIKKKILNILQNLDKYSSQSLSFLGYIYQLFNINKEPFCNKLLLDLPFSENEFEKPEIIIGLNKAGCNKKKYLLTYNLNDSIFKMNWTIQTIISYKQKPTNNLILILVKKIDDIFKNIKQIETNYIAVAFEALCFVYKSNNKITILNKIFQLLFELEQRKNCFNILYTFLDKSSRVDITGHIMNGLCELLL